MPILLQKGNKFNTMADTFIEAYVEKGYMPDFTGSGRAFRWVNENGEVYKGSMIGGMPVEQSGRLIVKDKRLKNAISRRVGDWIESGKLKQYTPKVESEPKDFSTQATGVNLDYKVDRTGMNPNDYLLQQGGLQIPPSTTLTTKTDGSGDGNNTDGGGGGGGNPALAGKDTAGQIGDGSTGQGQAAPGGTTTTDGTTTADGTAQTDSQWTVDYSDPAVLESLYSQGLLKPPGMDWGGLGYADNPAESWFTGVPLEGYYKSKQWIGDLLGWDWMRRQGEYGAARNEGWMPMWGMFQGDNWLDSKSSRLNREQIEEEYRKYQEQQKALNKQKKTN